MPQALFSYSHESAVLEDLTVEEFTTVLYWDH